jgi:tetratricopeptide (TPR) repeat protein
MRLLFPLAIALMLCAPKVALAQHFSWTNESCDAYAMLLDLQFARADSTIAALIRNDPKNLCATYLQDLSDFLYIVVTEDEKEFERRSKFKDIRSAQLGKAPDNDPFKNVALGELHLHWAFINMRFGNYFNGAMGIRKAFQLLEENTHRFPSYLPTYKGMGLLHTLVGTVPDNYQWAAKLMGVGGTVPQGMAELKRVINGPLGRPESRHIQKETLFLFAFLQMNLVNDDGTVETVKKHLQKQDGPLMAFATARVLQKQGKTDSAILHLETSLKKHPNVFPYLQYLLGDMKLSRLDADANMPLERFIRTYKGKSYVKSAHNKLAWHALLVKGSEISYRKHMSAISGSGSTMVDEDKAAQQEAEAGRIPNHHLLKARLLFDGGYLDKALEVLSNAPADGFQTDDEKLERSYRMGRIQHLSGQLNSAIASYESTVRMGAESKRYFAANASLQLGLIYEQLGEKEKARKHLLACSTFKNTEYRDSINQKAKAALMRL